MALQHMRIARPVSALSYSCEMYFNGLGLVRIGAFTDHDEFSGHMLGLDGLSWHLEFTQCHHHPVLPLPSNEDLLVLYIPEKKSWRTTFENIDDAGFARVKSFNPYWNRNGITFEDMDGYRVVIQNMHWGKL